MLKLDIPKFNGEVDSFRAFRFQVRAYGLARGWTHGLDRGVLSEEQSAEVYVLLATHVTGQAVETILGVTEGDGIEAWNKLEERYRSNRPTRKYQLLKDLLTKRCEDGNIAEWVQRKENQFEELKRIDVKMEDVLMSAVMNLLPHEYEAVADRMDYTNMSALKNAIRDKEDRLLAKMEVGLADVPMANAMRAMYGSEKGKNKGKGKGKGERKGKGKGKEMGNRCFNCGGEGHWKNECPAQGWQTDGMVAQTQALSAE